MAIFHLEAKPITRGEGRSAVAAAAYISCSNFYNEYDGLPHDYSHKGGLKYERVFLPAHAPPEWQDRAVLWNAVEEAEKTKVSRLAREIIVALPIELSLEQNIRLIEEYVQTQFVSDGMCADVCIYDTDGHNPHAHSDREPSQNVRTARKELLCDTRIEFQTVNRHRYSIGAGFVLS
ncbi:MAG: MobA/MobL family protein [Clostridia bacterium]|nr:MobA/MobL family protein [Clostridia bacterium]